MTRSSNLIGRVQVHDLENTMCLYNVSKPVI